jgi:hypothetical protein
MLTKILAHLTPSQGVFALRFVIAGVVAWIPSVATQQSAAFSYSQRGLVSVRCGAAEPAGSAVQPQRYAHDQH